MKHFHVLNLLEIFRDILAKLDKFIHDNTRTLEMKLILHMYICLSLYHPWKFRLIFNQFLLCREMKHGIYMCSLPIMEFVRTSINFKRLFRMKIFSNKMNLLDKSYTFLLFGLYSSIHTFQQRKLSRKMHLY